jgi:2-haloacid dehalogenase
MEASIERIGVPFELAIVASEIGSYKPAHRHWQRFFEETAAPREGHVHVAQSHFHDVVPATELGLSSIWINRYAERHELAPTRELRDLSRLPDTLDELVAA